MASEPGLGFSRDRRITRSGDIERLARSGSRQRSTLIDIRHLDSLSGMARAAVVVALYGNSAVERNKLKRRLRELVRVRMLPRIGPKDVLVRARRETYGATFEQLAAAVESATDRIAGAEST